VILLQGFDGAWLAFAGGDTLDGGGSGSGSGDIRYFVLDGRLSDVRIVVFAEFAGGGIDDKLDFTVFDGVDYVGSAFVHFEDGFAFDFILCEELMGAGGGFNFEAEVLKFSCGFQNSGFLTVDNGYQDSSLNGQGRLGCLLRFEVGHTERIGHSEDFTGRAHFGTKHRVDLLKHIEGEDGLFYAEMGDFSLFEVQVRKFFTEHKLGCQACHRDIADLRDKRDGS